MSDLQDRFRDVLAVTELRGSYPTVPIAGDVDYEGLITGDAAPVFVTLPIGKAGVTSGNGRHYDEAFLQELERQALANKPIGLMGHLSEAERATSFPPEAVHWVGALRVGDTLWGKAYVVPGVVRDRIQRYKAAGKAIATSIDAFCQGIWDETLKAQRMIAETLHLNQIDIAPADRAGIPDLAAVPLLTTEMEAEAEDEPGEEAHLGQEESMPVAEMIQELRKVRPPANRGWNGNAARHQQDEAAIRELLGVDDKTDVVGVVQEMQKQIDALTQRAIMARVTELVNEGVKVEAARGVVSKLVYGRDPQTVEEAESAYAEVMQDSAVKELLAVAVAGAAGPAAIVNGKVQEQGIPKLEDTPENRARAASQMGIAI